MNSSTAPNTKLPALLPTTSMRPNTAYSPAVNGCIMALTAVNEPKGMGRHDR